MGLKGVLASPISALVLPLAFVLLVGLAVLVVLAHPGNTISGRIARLRHRHEIEKVERQLQYRR